MGVGSLSAYSIPLHPSKRFAAAPLGTTEEARCRPPLDVRYTAPEPQKYGDDGPSSPPDMQYFQKHGMARHASATGEDVATAAANGRQCNVLVAYSHTCKISIGYFTNNKAFILAFELYRYDKSLSKLAPLCSIYITQVMGVLFLPPPPSPISRTIGLIFENQTAFDRP